MITRPHPWPHLFPALSFAIASDATTGRKPSKVACDPTAQSRSIRMNDNEGVFLWQGQRICALRFAMEFLGRERWTWPWWSTRRPPMPMVAPPVLFKVVIRYYQDAVSRKGWNHGEPVKGNREDAKWRKNPRNWSGNWMIQHSYSCQTHTLHFAFQAAVAATGLWDTYLPSQQDPATPC